MIEESLQPDDVRDAFRLVHELCEVGDDAYVWRARLHSELRRMIGANRASAYVMRTTLDPGAIGPDVLLMLNQQFDESWERYLALGDLTDNPMTPEIMRRFGTDFTCTRRELASDDEWYGSPFVRDVARPMDWDHSLISQVAITPPGLVDGFGLTRPPGEPNFTARDVALVRLVHGELARLWRRPGPLSVQTLPKRQREVLDGLRRGLSRKMIADKMGLSEHTVHDYVKSLFERAGVRSSGELLSRLAQRMQPNLLP